MKSLLRNIYLLSLVLLYASGARADGIVTIVTQLDGVGTTTGGQITAQVTDGVCTLTATPSDGCLITADNIKVLKVVAGEQAQARNNAPFLSEPILLTPVLAYDPMATSIFSFVMPASDFDVEVTANFRVSTVKAYPLWVGGVHVNGFNKDNILNDKNASLRFNPLTNTLSLYGATVEIADTTAFVRSYLDELTVDLHSTSFLSFTNGFVSGVTGRSVPLTFVTNVDAPGQLSWECPSSGTFSQGFKVIYSFPLSLQESGHLISQTPVKDYALKIGDVQVNSVNSADILSDGTVKFDGDHTLILTNANLSVPIISGLENLIVFLKGDNVINGAENLITSTESQAGLVFTTSPTTSGKLTLNKAGGEFFKGFSEPVLEWNLACLTSHPDTMTIGVPVPPIIDEENPTENNNIGDNITEGDDLQNNLIGGVLFNLDEDGYNDDDGIPGVILSSAILQSDVDEATNLVPGSNSFAETFSGLVFMIPPGTGKILLTVKVREDTQLAVQIGTNDPYIIGPSEDYQDYQIEYECLDATYVYLYSLLPESVAESRADIPFRGKVLHGHVKVTSVGASSQSMVSENSYSEETNTVTNKVKLFSLPASALTADGNGVVLSTIDVDDNTSNARGLRRTMSQKKITELAPTVFDELDKHAILYLDLSGTDISDFTVNRSSGLMSGFGSNTLLYMPEANDDGGDENVVLGDSCTLLSLYDDAPFCAPLDFVATQATLHRDMAAGQVTTILLPFALPQTYAETLGDFYTFNRVEEQYAVLNPKLTTAPAANIPYVFQSKTNDMLSVTNAAVKASGASSVAQGLLVGTYQPLSWESGQNDTYVIADTPVGDLTDAQFVRVDAGMSLPSFSAYLRVDDATSPLTLAIDGHIPNAISELVVSSSKADVLYDLQGRPLHDVPLKKGLYLYHGRKVLVQ